MGFYGRVEVEDSSRGRSSFETLHYAHREAVIAQLYNFCASVVGKSRSDELALWSDLDTAILGKSLHENIITPDRHIRFHVTLFFSQVGACSSE